MTTKETSISSLILLLLTLAMACAQVSASERAGSATAAFERLSTLVGTWRFTAPSGKHQSVAYRLTAGGSTLVETWTLGSGRESMTLYHLDGSDLIATHYCPQGNQPRLVLKPAGDATLLSFEFKDGTNLQAPGASHQHHFWLRFDSADTYTRSETYVPNGSSESAAAQAEAGAAITYERVTAALPSR